MTLGLVCDACDALSPVHATDCVRCGHPLGVHHSPAHAATAEAPRAAAAPAATPSPLVGTRPIAPPLPASIARAEASTPDAPATPDTLATPAPRQCPQCGADVPANHRFCGECGTRLDAPAPAFASGGKTAMFLTPMLEVGRARLILIKGEGMDSISYHLAGTEHYVGRTEGEILFPDDALISPRHANFFYRAGELHVSDEGSQNGVFLRINRPVRLVADQPFLVGEQLLVVQPAGVDGLAAADAEGTYYYGSPRRPARLRLLQILTGGSIGIATRVAGDTIAIGREGNHVNFPDDPFISGHHAQVEALENGSFRLTDVGSKNGTFVRVIDEARLEHGDYVFLGQQLLRVEIV